MAVPACPDCETPIQPDWDWCHGCGFDPEGLRPEGWTPDAATAPAPVAAATVGAGSAPPPPPPPPPPAADTPLASLRPTDLLRPRDGEAAPPDDDGPITGPLVAPEPAQAEHKPLTLDDVLKGSPRPAGEPAPPADPPADGGPASSRDRFSVAAERARPPRPSDLQRRADPTPRPPLFPAPDPGPPAPERPSVVDAPAASLGADAVDHAGPGVTLEDPPSLDELMGDEAHPYLDLPYDDPTPAPGSEPVEPLPTRRRLRRSPADERPNAATMAMAAGRMPSAPEADGVATPSGTLPPPPMSSSTSPAGASSVDLLDDDERPAAAPPPVRQPSSPADSSSLGPIVFGSSTPPPVGLARPKAKSSPLSWAAILMTIAIASIVLWGAYRNQVDNNASPALPPPSAGPIGYAPTAPDGSRAAVDPRLTASWATSSPEGGGFQVDMPGVVVVRTPNVPVGAGVNGKAVVASSTNGRGGYVVASVSAPDSVTWTSVDQASAAVLDGFDDTTGNDLTAGAPTTLGGLPAVSLDGTVDGVPSKGAIVLVGNRAYVALAGNVTDANLNRFLSSFSVLG